MCGLAGILYLGRSDNKTFAFNPPEHRAADRMMRAPSLNRRGPDHRALAEITDHQGHSLALLVSTRLAITDHKNQSANMPMFSNDGHLAIVYNGEIYNYQKLRAQLASAYAFKTHSDTEVILAAYQMWGDRLFDHLEGMYAFCIVDRETGQTLLAVDPAGQKPLLYSVIENERGRFLVFASDLESLCTSGLVPVEIDADAWRILIAMRYIPGQKTPLKHVRQLEPGTRITIDPAGAIAIARHFIIALDEKIYDSSIPDLASHFNQAIRRSFDEVTGDLEINPAFFLSSGVDSSALAALRLEKNLARDTDFYIAQFDEHMTIPDESQSAVAFLSGYPRAQSQIVPIGLESLKRNFREWADDTPDFMFSRDVFSLYSLYQQAHADHYRVILTGCGPDEILEGYTFGRRMTAMSDSCDDVAQNYLKGSCFIENLDLNRLFMSQWDKARADVAGYTAQFMHLYRPTTVMQAVQLINWHTRSQFECKKTDLLGGLFGMEARKPYYSRDFVNLCFQFPADWKVRDNIRKYPFRVAMADHVLSAEKAFIEKIAFTSPKLIETDPDLKHALIQYLKDDSTLRDNGIIDVDYLLSTDDDNSLIEQLYVYLKVYNRLKTCAGN